MGAEASILKSYELGLPYENLQDEGNCRRPKSNSYLIYPAVHKEDGSKVSIFVYNKNVEPKIGLSCAETLKLLRHPYILKFIGVVEGEKHLRLVTENVVPLGHCIHDFEQFEILAGLHNVLEALIFLHEKVKLVHQNLNMNSVFVSSQDGSWKIGCMEKAEKSNETGIGLDISCFVELAKSVLDSNRGPEEQSFLQKLEEDYADQTTANSKALKDLLSEPIFRNSYMETLKFLNCITMKSEKEKKLFFGQLGSNLRELNPKIVAKKLLPKLMSKMILAEPSAEKLFIPHLWTYGDTNQTAYSAVLPKDIYLGYCVPLILKLLRSKQIHVRLILLKYISLFVQAIDTDVLQDDVLPLILIGLRDENDAIVTATFHGLASIVPILGGAVVVGGERRKYFVDNRPNISAQQALQRKDSHGSSDDPLPTARKQKRRDGAKLKFEQQRNARNEEKTQAESNKVIVEEDVNSGRHIELLSTNAERETQNHVAKETVTHAQIERNTHDESEADWEGFEAFSSGSESEEKFEIGELKAMKSAENLLAIAKDSLQFANDASLPDKPKIETKQVAEDNAMKLKLTAKKPHNQQKSELKPAKRLGSEFEFDVVAKKEEPDFFADMMPDLSIKKTVVVEKRSPVISAKFEAVDDEVQPGWDTDDW